MNFLARPHTIEAAIRRTESELINIDVAWGGKGPSRLAGMGLSLDDKEERARATERLAELELLLVKSRMFYGS